jgi:parvulin-like peptidyl-prolyl isomerase
MDQPVITLKGTCKPASGSTTPAPGCVTTLTRSDFEKLTKALQPPDRPPMPAEQRRNFASQYAKLLIFADEARELGLENDPRVQEILKFAKNQILTEALNQHITEEYAHPSDQQIEAYYKQNASKYQEATLQRLIIPRITGSGEKPKPGEAEEKAYVDKMRQRWVGGEDPAKLQTEASDHAGVGTTAPDVNIGARRPDMVPEPHASVFELKPGEISQPFSDPASFYVYKVVSVRQVPLSEVKSTIVTTVQRQEIVDKIQQIQNSASADLNEAYFGPETKPTVGHSVITPKGPGGPPPASNSAPAPNSSAAPK